MSPQARFSGSNHTSIQTGDFELVEATYPAHLVMRRHGHARAYISCVLAGSYEEQIGHAARSVSAQSVVLHPEDEEHAVSFGGAGARILRVVIDDRVSRQVRELGIACRFEDWQQTAEANWIVARMHTEYERGDNCARLALQGLVLELLASGFRDLARKGTDRLRVAEEYLRAHFNEPVSLDNVARVAGLHPVYLARAFRQTHGMTVGDYLRFARVEYAAKLICAGDRQLGHIAAEAGFTDQAHLSRVFKQKTGVTPSQYRKAHRKG